MSAPRTHDLHAGIQVKKCGGYIERVRGLDSVVYMETSVVSINIHGISDAVMPFSSRMC